MLALGCISVPAMLFGGIDAAIGRCVLTSDGEADELLTPCGGGLYA